MTDYRRVLLQDRLAVRLQGITVANGYKSNVEASGVFKGLRELDNLDEGQAPGFMYEPAIERDEPIASGRERLGTLPIIVVGFVYAPDAHPSTAVEDLLGDFRKAVLNGDIHWGTHPDDGSYLADDTEIDPEGFVLIESRKKPMVGFRAVVLITYRYLASGP